MIPIDASIAVGSNCCREEGNLNGGDAGANIYNFLRRNFNPLSWLIRFSLCHLPRSTHLSPSLSSSLSLSSFLNFSILLFSSLLFTILLFLLAGYTMSQSNYSGSPSSKEDCYRGILLFFMNRKMCIKVPQKFKNLASKTSRRPRNHPIATKPSKRWKAYNLSLRTLCSHPIQRRRI